MEDLVRLHGVARKTANVVLGNAFGVQAGIMVDTHVMRVSQRLALTTNTDRDKIEQDLMRLVPRHAWTAFSQRMIAHGRRICNARAPRCRDCPLGEALCPSYLTAGSRSPAPQRPRASGFP
jgi:endonuclease-3